MAFPSSQYGAEARWSSIQGILDVLQGVSGGGDRVQLIQYNNGSNYALDVRNLDTTNGYGLRVQDGASANLLTVAKNAIGIGGSAADVVTLTGRVSAASLTHAPAAGVSGVLLNVGGTLTEAASGTHTRLSVIEIAIPTVTAGGGAVTDATTLYIAGAPSASGANNWAIWSDAGANRLDGTTYIGDSANTNCTLGLTINQAGNDNEAFAIKSSDIAHGVTDWAEADTYFDIVKNSADVGEPILRGFSTGAAGIILQGINSTDQTAKSTGARGPVEIRGYVRSGSGAVIPPTADSNLLVIFGGTTARFVFDVEGSGHQDVGTAWTEYDDYDDIGLLDSLNCSLSRREDPILQGFGAFLRENRALLQQLGVVTFNEDGHHFINWSKAQMLMIGALRQLGNKMMAIDHRLTNLEAGCG